MWSLKGPVVVVLESQAGLLGGLVRLLKLQLPYKVTTCPGGEIVAKDVKIKIIHQRKMSDAHVTQFRMHEH